MTPENSEYFIAAYTAATLVYGGYVVSLLLRARRARERKRRQRAAASQLSRAPQSEA